MALCGNVLQCATVKHSTATHSNTLLLGPGTFSGTVGFGSFIYVSLEMHTCFNSYDLMRSIDIGSIDIVEISISCAGVFPAPGINLGGRDKRTYHLHGHLYFELHNASKRHQDQS